MVQDMRLQRGLIDGSVVHMLAAIATHSREMKLA